MIINRTNIEEKPFQILDSVLINDEDVCFQVSNIGYMIIDRGDLLEICCKIDWVLKCSDINSSENLIVPCKLLDYDSDNAYVDNGSNSIIFIRIKYMSVEAKLSTMDFDAKISVNTVAANKALRDIVNKLK